MGNTYRVKILSPNSKIMLRGKILRTQVTCKNVYAKELDFLKLQIYRSSLKYELYSESEEDFKETNVNVTVSEKEDKSISTSREKFNKISDEMTEEIEIEELYDPAEGKNSLIDRLIEADQKRN